jgi:hypothetical protein
MELLRYLAQRIKRIAGLRRRELPLERVGKTFSRTGGVRFAMWARKTLPTGAASRTYATVAKGTRLQRSKKIYIHH